MVTFKYSLDLCAVNASINANTSPSNGVKTEEEARVACARKIDTEIAAHKARMERDIADLTRRLNALESLRNAMYVGELPPEPPKVQPQS